MVADQLRNFAQQIFPRQQSVAIDLAYQHGRPLIKLLDTVVLVKHNNACAHFVDHQIIEAL